MHSRSILRNDNQTEAGEDGSFNSLSRRQGSQGAPKCGVWRGGAPELLGEGVGWGELRWCLLRTSVYPLGAPGPMGERARAPYLLSPAWLFALAVRGRFTGGQDGGSSS